MTILSISTSFTHGGAGKVASDLNRELVAQDGIDVTEVCRDGIRPVSSVSRLLSVLRKAANAFAFRVASRDGMLNRTMWARLDIGRFDVAHIHNAHGYFMPLHVLRRIAESIPTVWSLHDLWAITGRCAVPAGCRGYLAECQHCPHLDYYPAAWIDHANRDFVTRRTVLSNPRLILVTPSDTIKKRLTGIGVESERIRVIPNPITIVPRINISSGLRRWKIDGRKSLGYDSPHSTFLLFVANKVDDPGKGFDTLAEAIRSLRSPKLRMIIVGSCSRAFRSRYDDLLADWLGRIDDAERLSEVYRSADVFVNPSYSESFGLTNLEAAAHGCSVVCSALDVFREITPGTFRFVPTREASDWADAIVTACSDSESSETLVSSAREVRERYSLSVIAERYRATFREASRK